MTVTSYQLLPDVTRARADLRYRAARTQNKDEKLDWEGVRGKG